MNFQIFFPCLTGSFDRCYNYASLPTLVDLFDWKTNFLLLLWLSRKVKRENESSATFKKLIGHFSGCDFILIVEKKAIRETCVPLSMVYFHHKQNGTKLSLPETGCANFITRSWTSEDLGFLEMRKMRKLSTWMQA